MEEEIRVPIYFMAGFLESGKSTFLDFTIDQDYFQIDGPTLLILCEEGEVEFDPKKLKKSRTSVEVIDKFEDLTPERLVAYDAFYRPERVIIEYNGMWQVSKFEEMQLPKDWGLVQQIVTVDASTFQIYMNNMKSLFVEMVRGADMVLFNRCTKDMPLASFRRSVKVVNQSAEIIFEDDEGEIEDIFAEKMPFDVEADVIDIMDEDYGIWFIDAIDHPETYEGKKVSFTAMVLKSRELPKNVFVPGRMAMTCCADDTNFIGYICRTPEAKNLKTGKWVKLVAEVGYEYAESYHKEGPVLTAISLEPAEPLAQELVYFN